MILYLGRLKQLRSTNMADPPGNFLYFHMAREFCITYENPEEYTQLRSNMIEDELGGLTRPKEPVM